MRNKKLLCLALSLVLLLSSCGTEETTIDTTTSNHSSIALSDPIEKQRTEITSETATEPTETETTEVSTESTPKSTTEQTTALTTEIPSETTKSTKPKTINARVISFDENTIPDGEYYIYNYRFNDDGLAGSFVLCGFLYLTEEDVMSLNTGDTVAIRDYSEQVQTHDTQNGKEVFTDGWELLKRADGKYYFYSEGVLSREIIRNSFTLSVVPNVAIYDDCPYFNYSEHTPQKAYDSISAFMYDVVNYSNWTPGLYITVKKGGITQIYINPDQHEDWMEYEERERRRNGGALPTSTPSPTPISTSTPTATPTPTPIPTPAWSVDNLSNEEIADILLMLIDNPPQEGQTFDSYLANFNECVRLDYYTFTFSQYPDFDAYDYISGIKMTGFSQNMDDSMHIATTIRYDAAVLVHDMEKAQQIYEICNARYKELGGTIEEKRASNGWETMLTSEDGGCQYLFLGGKNGRFIVSVICHKV